MKEAYERRDGNSYWSSGYVGIAAELMEAARTQRVAVPALARWLSAGRGQILGNWSRRFSWLEALADNLDQPGWKTVLGDDASLKGDLERFVEHEREEFAELLETKGRDSALAVPAHNAIDRILQRLDALAQEHDAEEPLPFIDPRVIKCVASVRGRHNYRVLDIGTVVGPASSLDQHERPRLASYFPSVAVIESVLRNLPCGNTPGEHSHPSSHIGSEESLSPVPVVRHVCLPSSNMRIGLDGSGRGGRSLELPVVLAAVTAACGGALIHDRVVVTGRVEPDPRHGARVVAVEDIPEKVEAVLAWAKGSEARPAVLILPRANEPQVRPKLKELDDAGVETRFVDHLDEALVALPRLAPAVPRRVKVIGAVTFATVWLLYGERLILAEWLADPLYRASHPLWSTVALSLIPALLPAAASLYPLQRAAMGKTSLSAWKHGIAVLAVAVGVMGAIQWSFGGFDVPELSPFMFRPKGGPRQFYIFEDIWFFYPVLITFGLTAPGLLSIAGWLKKRDWALSPQPVQTLRLRESDRRWALPYLSKMMPVIAALFVVAPTLLLRGDIAGTLERLGNTFLVAHFVFQILMAGFVSLLMTALTFYLPRNSRMCEWWDDDRGGEMDRRMSASVD